MTMPEPTFRPAGPLSRRTALRVAVLASAGAAAARVLLADDAAAATTDADALRWTAATSPTLRAPLQRVAIRASSGETVDVAYRSVGRGRPLLMLQRFRGTLDLWDPLFVDLLARDHRVVLFDAPGVGASGGTVPAGISAMADDAAAVAAALRLDRGDGSGGIDVLGWSMGGMTAQALAARHPRLVRRLVLDGTTAPGNPDLRRPSDAWVQVAVKPTYSFEDIVRLFYTQSPASRAAAAASEERIAARRDPVPPVAPDAVGIQATATFGFFDDTEHLFPLLRTITAPTLIGAGDHDDAFPVRDSVVLLEQIPDADLVVYPDSGHGFQFQYPVDFAHRIRTFLAA
jgi:pimeloyl-ACP methyl ester carboxylesterase